MTLEDFISRFNSNELASALKQQKIPNFGTDIDKIIRLADHISGESEIVYLLSVLKEFRLREISLGLGVSGAGTMDHRKLKRRVALIVLNEYETLEESLSKIENLHSIAIVVSASLIGMILFICAAFIFETSSAFIVAFSMSISAGFYGYWQLQQKS